MCLVVLFYGRLIQIYHVSNNRDMTQKTVAHIQTCSKTKYNPYKKTLFYLLILAEKTKLLRHASALIRVTMWCMYN